MKNLKTTRRLDLNRHNDWNTALRRTTALARADYLKGRSLAPFESQSAENAGHGVSVIIDADNVSDRQARTLTEVYLTTWKLHEQPEGK